MLGRSIEKVQSIERFCHADNVLDRTPEPQAWQQSRELSLRTVRVFPQPAPLTRTATTDLSSLGAGE